MVLVCLFYVVECGKCSSGRDPANNVDVGELIDLVTPTALKLWGRWTIAGHAPKNNQFCTQTHFLTPWGFFISEHHHRDIDLSSTSKTRWTEHQHQNAPKLSPKTPPSHSTDQQETQCLASNATGRATKRDSTMVPDRLPSPRWLS